MTTPSLAVGGDGLVRCANREGEALLGAPAGGLAGRPLQEVLGSGLGREMLATARRAMVEGGPRRSASMWRGYWARGRFTPIAMNGEAMCIIAADSWRCPLGAPESAPLPCDEFVTQDLGDLGRLTAREVEVLWWLARDATVPEIARHLSRSAKTVESHIRSLSAKTGRSGRLALAQLANERHIPHMTRAQIERVFATRDRLAGAAMR